jgi:hypothetical protein
MGLIPFFFFHVCTFEILYFFIFYFLFFLIYTVVAISSPCAIHGGQNAVEHVRRRNVLLEAFCDQVSQIPAAINVSRDKEKFPLRCPENQPQRFFYLTNIVRFLLRFADQYRSLFRGVAPVTVANLSFGALVLEPVRALTMSLEPNSCTLPCVLPLLLQFLYFYKLIQMFQEIPLPPEWVAVVRDLSREFVFDV